MPMIPISAAAVPHWVAVTDATDSGPSEAAKAKQTLQLGGHVFFKDVP